MKIALGMAVVLLAAGIGYGQGTDGAITGTVRDSSGAIVAGAKVVAENKGRGVRLESTTNAAGLYSFPALAPGEYRLVGEAAGFRKSVLENIRLEVAARLQLDLTLEVGAAAEVVEVTADGKIDLAYATTTIGGTVDQKRILDLPVTSRSVLAFTTLQAGTVGGYFSGNRIGTLNISVDGVNVQDARINTGVASPLFLSVDRIAEVNVSTSPVDAELGRGAGQVRAITRSGSNNLQGSAFWQHRNTVLNANNWFNNFQGRDAAGKEIAPRNNLIRNQFGFRVGGPVVLPKLYNGKDKTFFHFLYEGQRQREKGNLTAVVPTAQARQGIFRYFPGVQNANTLGVNPVVDAQGNPRTPNGATGALQTVNLFGRDPNRLVPDSTGAVRAGLAFMPEPNVFTAGDGLNTAGYLFARNFTNDLDNINMKFDHYFNAKHKMDFSWSRDRNRQLNGFQSQRFPTAPGGTFEGPDDVYSLNYNWTISPRVINEARIGILRSRLRFNAPWEVGDQLSSLPRIGSTPYLLDFITLTDPILTDNDPQGRFSPNYQYSDSVAWTSGRHNFKTGGQVWFVSSNGFNSFDVMPRVVIGPGSVPVVNINTIAGIGANATAAENLLMNLAGSVANVRQAFNSPGGTNPQFVAGEGKQRVWQQREYAFYFKDDWRVTKSFTLNLGIRYELFGVPMEKNGKAASVVGGGAGLFGISGSDTSALFRPGATGGALTQVNVVGPNSPNPNLNLYRGDHNNFAPSIGMSWSLPWLGKDKTILRAGYSMGYERNSLRILDVVSGDQPGLRSVNTQQTSGYRNISGVTLPLPPLGSPLATVPFTDRLQTVRAYDQGLRTPYVQNWNFSLQRSLPKGVFWDLRYVGSKGTKLIRGFNLNEQNAFETGLAEAFIAAQSGQESALLDRIFAGARGTSTGSVFARTNATTAAALANNNLGAFTNFINSVSFNGRNGGLLSTNGFPENFIVVNPQFAAANLSANVANSTYHSFQTEVTKRTNNGLTLQANYTFAKALGEEEGEGQEMLDSYRTQRNRRLDKRMLSFSVKHVFRSNLLYELPFGPGKKFLNSRNGILSRIVGGWQVGNIYNVFSGDPLGFSSAVSSFNQFTDATPVATQALGVNPGQVSVGGNGVTFFPGWTSVLEPSRAGLTTLQSLQARSTLRAVADASGNIILRNPSPGTLGTMAQRAIYGPSTFRLDTNLVKRISITERVSFELNITAENLTNTPQWGNPNLDFNSLNFGRITEATGVRIVTFQGRINF
jgi:hypothetical protein